MFRRQRKRGATPPPNRNIAGTPTQLHHIIPFFTSRTARLFTHLLRPIYFSVQSKLPALTLLYSPSSSYLSVALPWRVVSRTSTTSRRTFSSSSSSSSLMARSSQHRCPVTPPRRCLLTQVARAPAVAAAVASAAVALAASAAEQRLRSFFLRRQAIVLCHFAMGDDDDGGGGGGCCCEPRGSETTHGVESTSATKGELCDCLSLFLVASSKMFGPFVGKSGWKRPVLFLSNTKKKTKSS